MLGEPIVDGLITDRDSGQRANAKATDSSPQIPLRDPSMQQTPQDACCQQLIAHACWASSLLPDGGFARLLDRLHQQGFHQRGWGLDHWQIPLSRGIIRHREVSFFSFKDSFEKDCPLFFSFWQPLSGISWSRCQGSPPFIPAIPAPTGRARSFPCSGLVDLFFGAEGLF